MTPVKSVRRQVRSAAMESRESMLTAHLIAKIGAHPGISKKVKAQLLKPRELVRLRKKWEPSMGFLCWLGFHNWKSGSEMWQGPDGDYRHWCIRCDRFK